jgi:predicted RecA/RadA family phage recombinase
MNNLLSVPDYSPVSLVAPGALTAGQPFLFGLMFGIAGAAAASGAPVAMHRRGRYLLTKVTTDDVAVGVKLYWDNSASKVTVTVSSNTFIGYACKAAGTSATQVEVELVQT